MNHERIKRLQELFIALCDLDTQTGLTSSPPKKTKAGTVYLTDPGVILVARPQQEYRRKEDMRRFLYDLDPTFEPYADEEGGLHDGAALAKLAGQLCYLSFGPKRTMNADAEKYFQNILSSGHGSVLEHANFSFLIYGVSRSFTHELVRHRAGCAYSQVSQRYVDKPRFVERAEYQKDPGLHEMFERWIDRSMEEYESRAAALIALQETDGGTLSAETKTERRKKVNQSARECLPNETEAPIVFTGNVRALRHVIGMRASKHADTQIREVFVRIFLILALIEPVLFMDGEVETLPDGTHGVVFQYPKV
ncbi:MAG: FAD-dependent thymidylate synthase [Vicinamibacteria bacterium]